MTAEQVAGLARELLAAPLTAAVVGPYDGEDELPPPCARWPDALLPLRAILLFGRP